jgi:RNA polymerase sigma-70 factor (ECF subfamily)
MSCIAAVAEPCGLTFADLAALPDDLVMAHLGCGHDDALAVLFDRYHDLVFQVAVKILRDIGEAEDVLQNIFMELYQVAARFDPSRGTAKTWIFQYAYHRSLNRRQQLTSRRFYCNTELSEVQHSLVSASGTPLGGEETKRLVRQALDTLNKAQRQVLELAYFEGLSLKEIAEQTAQTFGNVRHHYYRGLRQMRLFLLSAGPTREESCKQEAADART